MNVHPNTTTDPCSPLLQPSILQDVVAGIATNKEPEYIEEMINKQAKLVPVLRLLCLYSMVNNGLKPKQYDFFRKEILETYGYEHIQTLENLRRLGMLTKQVTTKNTYSLVRSALSLIVDEVNEHAPNDISYVYSGYAPLSVRLVQCVVQQGKGGKPGASGPGGKSTGSAGGGWKGFENVLRMLPGRTFDETQRVDDGQPRSSKSKWRAQNIYWLKITEAWNVEERNKKRGPIKLILAILLHFCRYFRSEWTAEDLTRVLFRRMHLH